MLSAFNTLRLHISERVSESNYPLFLDTALFAKYCEHTLFLLNSFFREHPQSIFSLLDASEIAKLDVSFHNSHEHDVVVLSIALGSDRLKTVIVCSSDQMLPWVYLLPMLGK